MWTKLMPGDEVGARKCAEVMRGIDPAYKRLTPGRVLALARDKVGQAFLYESGMERATLILRRDPRRGGWRVHTCGFANLEAAGALDKISQKLVEFLRGESLTKIRSLTRRVASVKFNEFLLLLESSSVLHFSVESNLGDQKAILLELPGPHGGT